MGLIIILIIDNTKLAGGFGRLGVSIMNNKKRICEIVVASDRFETNVYGRYK